MARPGLVHLPRTRPLRPAVLEHGAHRARQRGHDRRATVRGEWRDRALGALYEHCQQARSSGTTYVPVWEVRAAVCWKLRIVDDEFDRAVTDMIAGRRGEILPWRLHLDQVSVGNAPSSAAPFVLTTSAVGTRTYNVMTVVPKTTSS